MSAITEADIENMSDKELYNTLKSHGFDVGPIVASTRGIYKKKLIQKLKTQHSTTSAIPGLNSRNRDTSFHNDVVSHAVEKSSRNSVERPDSSNRYSDVNVSRSTTDRKSFSQFTTTSAAYDDQEDEENELEEEAEIYERHSPSKLSQSYASYSRQSYEPSTVGLGQSRASDYGRSVGDRLTADYSDVRTGTGSLRSSLGGFESTSVGSGYRSSLGETASERADRILEDIRRRSALASGSGYRPLSEADRLSRSRDILEQARKSGRLSKSQTYGTQKSVLSEYFLKIIIGLVLFVCIYFIITSLTQPSSLQAIDQEVNEILKDSEQINIE